MAMKGSGPAAPAQTAAAATAPGVGTESDEGSLVSALDGLDQSSDPNPDGAEVDASESAAGEHDDGASDSSDAQGSDPADSQDGEESDREPEKPGKRDKIQERINELTARRKEAESERDALKAELQKLKGQGEKPADGARRGFDPIEDDDQIAELNGKGEKARSEAEAARTLRRQLRSDPERVLALLKRRGVEVDGADAAADWLEDYEADARDRAAEARVSATHRRAELERVVAYQRKGWDDAAQERYPWLADPEDPRQEAMATALKSFPWIARLPQGRAALAALADMAHAAKAKRQPEAKASPARSEARPPGVRPSPSGGGPVSRPGSPGGEKAQRMGELEKRLDQNPGDDEAMVELLSQGLG